MNHIKVNLGSRSYKIFILENQFLELAKFLQSKKLGNKYAIITDDKVKKLYGKPISTILKEHDIQSKIFSFKNGEGQKNMNTILELSEKMIANGFDRQDAIIALGGGVVGDMGGFIASIYMRGIPFIQIPTTLLAMVDASIGGKTGINLPSGKNLLGTFAQPQAVFIYTQFLQTLSPKQIKNGLAEVIKYAVIQDPKLFQYLEKNRKKILDLEEKAISLIIKKSVSIKAQIVEKDEKESDLRMTLNYGHTYGHAIEKMSEYKLLHGYAISIGMVLENELAVSKSILSETEAQRIKKLIKSYDLPVFTMKKPEIKDLKSDKKKSGNHISIIVPKAIGQTTIIKLPC